MFEVLVTVKEAELKEMVPAVPERLPMVWETELRAKAPPLRVRDVPEGSEPPELSCSVPVLMVVDPVYVLPPVKVRVSAPDLMREPAPEMTPAKVEGSLLERVRAVPLKVIEVPVSPWRVPMV